ncbi:MAG: hypothetical protein KKH98_00655, partial [Spirochaetes bacterium]|nr:hypothetical protein [Spirochaetota bacterium]
TIVPESADKTLNITVLGEELKIGYSSSMPAVVYKGGTSVSIMTLFMQNDNGGTNHDEVTLLKLKTENSNNAGINADTVLSRIIITDGTNVYKNMTAIPSSSIITIDMSSSPIKVNAGSTKAVFVTMDVSTTASTDSIQLNLNTDTDVTARDKTSQISIGVTTNTGFQFPMRSSYAVIYSNYQATVLDAGLIDSMPLYAERSETNILTAKIFFTSTNNNVNSIKVTELNLVIEDLSGAGIIPNSVLSKVQIKNANTGSVYLEDTTMESSGTNIFLDLSTDPILIPNQTSVTINVIAGISSSAYSSNFQLNLKAAGSIKAKDQILNTVVSVYPATGYAFPMRTGNAVIAAYFLIVHDGQSDVDTWEQIIFRICNTNGTIITNYTGTITLDTDGTATTIDWTNNYFYGGSFTEGGALADTATYQFAVADRGVITLSIRDSTSENINITCYDRWIVDLDNEGLLLFMGLPNISISKSVAPLNARPFETLTYAIFYSNITSYTARSFSIVENMPTNVVLITNSAEISNNPHIGSAAIFYSTNTSGTNWFPNTFDTPATIFNIKRIKWVLTSPVGDQDKGILKFKSIIK